MRESVGASVVLLDGDLQDPPELIADFWAKREEGFDVIFGRRVDRDAPWIMRRAYKTFYRVFQALAPFNIPRDAGDFSLMSRDVVDVIIDMPERDLFIRAQRAYAGFKQAGVDYKRPERMFGTSTNNLGRNLGWATRGVLAVSRAPLTGLSLFALGLFGLSVVLIIAQILSKIFLPSIAPQGLVSLSVLILGLGSLNLLAIAVVGEYVGRILEETKRRPRYVRRLITEFGTTRSATRSKEARDEHG
jgi:dolichol-phosphate mannosyltransferase